MNNNGTMKQKEQQAREEYEIDMSVARLVDGTPIKNGARKLTEADALTVIHALGKLLKQFDG